MDITRELIEKISKENNLTTVSELLDYIDHEEYYELTNQKDKELSNGILSFRYKDKEERLNMYRKELYEIMINAGKILNKEKCGINEEVKNDIKFVCRCVFECEYQKYDFKLQTNLCSDNDEDCKYCIKI